MNDDIREKLSAYLDGALSEMDRKSVEEQLALSADMRGELEALRAVSGAVKDLPREPLPGGFLARLQARRARETQPVRDWVILPPSYRPLAAAMSMGIVAFVLWDKAHGPSDLAAPRTIWDGASDRIAVKTASQVPSSIDVSGRLSSMNENEPAAAKLNIAPAGRRTAAPGKPLGIAEEAKESSDESFAGAGGSGFASLSGKGAPAAPAAAALDSDAKSYLARNEEERSAINERLYKNFEEEKKRMGIAQIVAKDADDKPERGRADLMTLGGTSETQSLAKSRSVAAFRGQKNGSLGRAKAKTEALVAVKALALKSPEALQAAWDAASLPGAPPTVKFPEEMALFLAGPRGCGIVSIQNRKKFIVVLYKDAGFDDASARVRAVTLSPKPVVVKLAE